MKKSSLIFSFLSFLISTPLSFAQTNSGISELVNELKKQDQRIRYLEKEIIELQGHSHQRQKIRRDSNDHSILDIPYYRQNNSGSVKIPRREINNNYISFPLVASPPGTFESVSNMPSNSGPILGVSSEIPNRTTEFDGLILKWGKGLPSFSTPDGNYSFRVRGRILADYGASFSSRFPQQNISRTILRAARLGVQGRARNLSWVLEGDFSSNTLQLMSAFATWTDKTAGLLSEYTIGNKFSERGFDGSTGSSDTVFLNRDIVANLLVPMMGWYGLGGAYKIYGKNWHIATQISGDQVNSTNNTNNVRDDLTYLLRAHYIPFKDKASLIHLGFWGFYEDSKPTQNYTQNVNLLNYTDNAFNFQVGPTAPLSHSLSGGVELFGIWKSFWGLFEFGLRKLSLRRTYSSYPNYALWAGKSGSEEALSVQGGVFLTGETPNYFAHSGVWAAPRVLHPVTQGGVGAWEVALRYDRASVSRSLGSSNASTVTLGVNWYFLNYARFMFNFTHANVLNTDGLYIGYNSGNTLGGRMSITF
ncbi:OprO/OprP family phosphate-selective porin [Gluconobacter kondonii]|uniref:OprO/OprP family phosphate-selective porin n=1 Tax=Gluconobacter kondonii TaxID=941463 RepID=UPI001B8BAB7B|nr:porin [Gluconobacter kondonii]MBS1083654.1 hypothetical protein [Gluconobacter kondonii]